MSTKTAWMVRLPDAVERERGRVEAEKRSMVPVDWNFPLATTSILSCWVICSAWAGVSCARKAW